MKVIKRNGTEVDFDVNKIIHAIKGANNEVPDEEQLTKAEIEIIANRVEKDCNTLNHTPHIEEIQDFVEKELIYEDVYPIAKRYILYRYEHELKRKGNTTDATILSLVDCDNEDIKQENSNKNPVINSTQRDYIAGEVSKDLTERILLPKKIWDAHKEGIIHFHDADYFLQRMNNCGLVNLDDMLQNGTVISGTMIEKPHTFSTACNIATQIVAQVASSQYGGQSISLAHLSKFIDCTRQKYLKRFQFIKDKFSGSGFHDFIEGLVDDDIEKGIQTFQYQLITLLTTNGQAPFVTLYLNLNEAEEGRQRDDLARAIKEVFKQRITGVKNEKGVYITPAFPKLIYNLDENNIHEDSEYFYLTELAAKCTAKRMVPDYVSAKIERKLKNGDEYPPMGCRSFLTPDRTTENYGRALNYEENKGHKYYGRFNMGVVTINLPDVALSSHKDKEKFWKIFDERLELCYEALMCRYERVRKTVSDVAPILWQYGAYARLNKGETIEELCKHGYATISLGYAGLYECVKYMTGKSHTDPEAKPFALSVMQHMNDKCAEWKAKTDLDFSLYGTPLESTVYKFAKCLQNRFGIIDGVTSYNYISNSYHISVREEIDAFHKLAFESEFQELSPGGAISYVEVPDLQKNIDSVITLIQFIYDTILYAELNTKSDYCQVCGYDGEIEIKEDEHKKLYWRCPNCGNTDQNKMNVARRTCGYIGTYFWNQGRTQEIRDRVLHL